MLRGFSIFLIIILTSSPLFGSEISEILLPELNGLYSAYDGVTRIAAFQLDRTPSIVYNAWIKLSGEFHVGLYHCDWNFGYFWSWREEFFASMNDSTTGGVWNGNMIIPNPGVGPYENGYFEIVIPFSPYSGATWEFLNSGAGVIELLGKHEYMYESLSCGGVDIPYAIVEAAMLVIEADIKVAVEPKSWSRIKSMYSD